MKVVGGVARYDITKDEDMAALIRNGLIWKSGPKTIALAVQYLRDHPEAINSLVPTSVSALLQPQAQPAAPADVLTPGDQPDQPAGDISDSTPPSAAEVPPTP